MRAAEFVAPASRRLFAVTLEFGAAIPPLRDERRCGFRLGRVLLVNRAVARFILRPRSAGSKGCAPACHDASRP
jgi:hypothetical protein